MIPNTSSGTLLDALVESLRRAGDYNPDDQVAPLAVLWPDGERQWEPLLPLLRDRLPILTLGTYDPATRSGPAIYLRCMLGRTLSEDLLLDDAVPVVYLPGVSRQELRSVTECPRELLPLVELQYRGTVWTHPNGRDWSIAGYLQSPQAGLGIQVATDSATRVGLLRALTVLARQPLDAIREQAPIREAYLNELLNPDPPHRLLLWMDDPKGYRPLMTDSEWDAFCQICRKSYGFDPQKDGELTAAVRLGTQIRPWDEVWERYVQAPRAYPHLPDLLLRARPPRGILDPPLPYWPQDTDYAEAQLRESLVALSGKSVEQVRARLSDLEKQHGHRRAWVWAGLDRAPLAAALAPLMSLADLTATPVSEGDVAKVAASYADGGWRADAAVLEALSHAVTGENTAAIRAPIVALYRPWLEKAALALQHAVLGNPQERYRLEPLHKPSEGTCILFSDALRLDLAHGLADRLAVDGCVAAIDWRLAALPTITATAKPALLFGPDRLTGASDDLGLRIVQTGAALDATAFRQMVLAEDYQVLVDYATGDPAGLAWTEIGALDQYGHGHGAHLAQQVSRELDLIARRIKALLDAGWKQVVVVTDHGWLLLPGGLPKCELPEHLTHLRKGRCALLKEGALTDQDVVPWHWNPDGRIAMAPGISCFEAGKEYEHGSLSPQECVVPVITVTASGRAIPSVSIQDVRWTGFRCRLTLQGALSEMTVDIRTKAGDASTSVVSQPGEPNKAGDASVLVEDDTLQGTAAIIVVVAPDGVLCAQQHTTIGG